MSRSVLIQGFGRSGSTLAARLLAASPDVVSVGELWKLPNAWKLRGAWCGCGELVYECAFWQEVITVFGHPNLDRMGVLADRPASMRSGEYGVLIDALHGVVSRVSSCEVVCDSTKRPEYLRALTRSGRSMVAWHMIRDARGVVASMQRAKERDDVDGGGILGRASTTRAAFAWTRRNTTVEYLVSRYGIARVRTQYEEFVSSPITVLRRVTEAAGAAAPALSWNPERRTVRPPVSHTVAGNPDRMETGPIEIRLDDRWRESLADWQLGVALVLTWPLMWNYGYCEATATDSS